jgi:glycosyltransferase involved in cell wall biosynthesis
MTPVKFSIITINLNNLSGLIKTCDSVFKQQWVDYEFIVIDGGSTDGSIEFLIRNNSKITFWISEPDEGIYNAMNKGIKKCCGEYVQFLNSGDCLAGFSVLSQLSVFITLNSGADFYYSDVIDDKTKNIICFPRVLSFNYFFQSTINHQSTFFKRELFVSYGGYSECYKIVSDWEYFLKLLFLHSCSYRFVGFPTVSFDFENGISTSNASIELIEVERKQVLHELFPYFIADYYYLNSILNSRTFKLIQLLSTLRRRMRLS